MYSLFSKLVIPLIVYLFLPFQSSFAVYAPSCDSARTDFIFELIEYIEKKQISKIDHDLEIQALRDKKASLLSQLKTIDFELNAQSSYTKSLNSVGSIEERDIKNTDLAISAITTFSKEKQLKNEKITIQLNALEKQISLATFRNKKETLLNLLDMINLKYQIDNSLLKLTIIEKQIEYYNMLKIIGTPQIKRLTDAELEKLRVDNELVNLDAKLGVERSKLVSPDADALLVENFPAQLPIDPELQIKICALFDPEQQIKKLNLREQELNLKIARVQSFPQLKFELGLTSKDYHSGAHANNASIGISLSGPLMDGGVNASQVTEAQQNYDLAKKDFEVHKIKFDKKASNFFGLEASLMRSLLQAKAQIKSNKEQIQELTERQVAGFSVFQELSERKLQQFELTAISKDIEGRLLTFWSNHLENFIERIE
jgi:hypothetical protein